MAVTRIFSPVFPGKAITPPRTTPTSGQRLALTEARKGSIEWLLVNNCYLIVKMDRWRRINFWGKWGFSYQEVRRNYLD
jgi:hypothetical protein